MANTSIQITILFLINTIAWLEAPFFFSIYHHDITEILLKVVLNTITLTPFSILQQLFLQSNKSHRSPCFNSPQLGGYFQKKKGASSHAIVFIRNKMVI
jgi:hypothetical protein